MKKFFILLLLLIFLFGVAQAENKFQSNVELILEDTLKEGIEYVIPECACDWRYLFDTDFGKYYAFFMNEGDISNIYFMLFSKSDKTEKVADLYTFVDYSYVSDDFVSYRQINAFILIWVNLLKGEIAFDATLDIRNKFAECINSYSQGDFSATYTYLNEYGSVGIKWNSESQGITLITSFNQNDNANENKYVEFPNTEKYRDISEPLVNQALIKFGSQEMTEVYLTYFDSIWGELTEVEGKVVYSTITPKQEKLINYPELNVKKVYYAPNGKSYHSTDWCYTLLKSNTIRECSLTQAQKSRFSPCSKCIR